jgi:hypothetical protein
LGGWRPPETRGGQGQESPPRSRWGAFFGDYRITMGFLTFVPSSRTSSTS